MITLVTPVGTSLFTNYLLDKEDKTFSNNYDTIKNLFATKWDSYDPEIQELRGASIPFIKDVGKQASAELQSIANIQAKLNDQITVRLLASDTIASRLAAEILKEGSEQNPCILGNNVTVEFDIGADDVITGLQVEDPESFSQDGMTNLIQRINSISSGLVGSQTFAITRDFAINITGGYKATLPYLTILAQLERVPLYYNFEDTDALIKIPQAPLVIDWASIERHSDVLREIDEGIEDWGQFKKDNHQAVKDLEAFIEVAKELALMSPIGQIFWNHYQRYFVVDLPSGSYFGYNADDRQLIDEAVKELYRRLDTALRESYFEPNACFCHSPSEQECKNSYCCIRNLGHNDDLNHGGQIPGQDIFIFKSTDDTHIRLLYTFDVKAYPIEVNGAKSDVGEITRLTIFDLHCREFDHDKYIDEWKNEFKDKDRSEMDFIPRIFDIPQEVLTKILRTRNQKIR